MVALLAGGHVTRRDRLIHGAFHSFEDNEQVASILGLPVQAVAITPFTMCQMERVLAEFPHLVRFDIVQSDMLDTIIICVNLRAV